MDPLKSVIDTMRQESADFEARCERYQSCLDEIDEEIVGLFVEQMVVRLNALEGALPLRDYGVIKRAAHSIKGMGGTVGYPEVSVGAEDLEVAAAEEDEALCARHVQLLGRWLAAFREARKS